MEPADPNFRACFLGIGERGQEVGQHVMLEFKSLMNNFKKCREDDPDFSPVKELPELTIRSVIDESAESINELQHQEIIFLLGPENDPFFWKLRRKLIDLKDYYLLFTFPLSQNRTINFQGHIDHSESMMYIDDIGTEERVIAFVRDICRFKMFPNLLSCDMSSLRNVLANTFISIISFESRSPDYLREFKQLLANEEKQIKKAAGIFYLVSSSLGSSFSITNHYQPIIKSIEDAAECNCVVIGSDSLSSEIKYPIEITILCAKKKRIDADIYS